MGYNYGPRSVAVGDFNNDTWLDMVIANYIANNITIYLGYSNGTFASPTKYSTGSGSASYMAVVGHFNNDFRLDIAVANYGTNSIGIFLGFGNESFASQIETSTGSSRPISIGIADFNNDTLLDIVTADYGTHSVSVYYGYGNGSFASPIRYSTGYDSFPSSTATGDFNNDNYLDIAIANYGTDNIAILLGNRNDSFANQTIFRTFSGSHPISLTVGHFDDDTFLDIAVANYGTNSIGIHQGNGNGTFLDQMNYPIGSASPYSIGVRDINQDNRLDLIATSKGTNNTAVLIGYGNGTFDDPVMYPTGASFSTSFDTGDFNKDSWQDFVVVNNDTGAIDIVFGYFEGFLNQMTYSTGDLPQSVAVGDFNKDARLDVVVANQRGNSVSVILGHGNGSFAEQMTYSTGSFIQQVTYTTGSYLETIAVGDFNNDTQLDIVVVNPWNANVSVLFGDAVGDFNNDSQPDIVVAYYDRDSVSVLLAHVNIVFVNQTVLTTGNDSQSRSFVIADFNNHDRMDIGVAKSSTHSVGIFLGYGNISFANQITYSTGSDSSPYSIASGDFNNDDYLDLVVANYGSDNVGVFLGYGNDGFAQQITYSTITHSSPRSIAVADMNNDNLLDIVVANYGTNTLGVFIGHSNGTFATIVLVPMNYGSQPFSIVVGDFNNDRKLDFAVANNGTDNLNIFLQTC